MGKLWQKTSGKQGVYLMAMEQSVHPQKWTVEEQIKHAIA
jgi:hypothetical protein